MRLKFWVSSAIIIATMIGMCLAARADMNIGQFKTAKWFACDTEEKAVAVVKVDIVGGMPAALELFNQTLGCLQFPVAVPLMPFKVVWHRELHDGSGVLKVVHMTHWKDKNTIDKHVWIITEQKVIGSDVVGSLPPPLYFPVAEKPRLYHLYGLLCNDLVSLRTVIDTIDEMGGGAIDAVNKDAQTCTFYPEMSSTRALSDSVHFMRTEQSGKDLLYLYEANIIGYMFYPLIRPVVPPVKQYFYTKVPIHPEDKEEGA